jgi:RNA polymerase sigma factor (TIGR02999 family)
VNEITQILEQIDGGDSNAAARLLPLVYDDLRRLAAARIASENPGQTLQATALVHEAYLRLVGASEDRQWNSRNHFFAAAAEAMRRILVESARRKRSQKRGGDGQRLELLDVPAPAADANVDVLALSEALEELEQIDQRRALLVKLRYFAGFTTQEAADSLGVSRATAVNDWTFACCWLKTRIMANA